MKRFLYRICSAGVWAFLSITNPGLSQTDTPLKIVTFNLHGWQGDWPARQAMILEELAEIQPDIVGFQEVLETPGTNGIDNSAKIIAERLSKLTGIHYNMIFTPTHLAWAMYDEGIAIMTRHTILDEDFRVLPSSLFARKALWAKILTPQGIVHFVTTHLHHVQQDEATRVSQVNLVKSFIAEKDTTNHAISVLCGDFNATPGAASIQLLVQQDSTGIRYGDTWAMANPGSPGFTIPAEAPNSRIDYIFVKEKQPLQNLTVKLVFNQRGAQGFYASDHIGVRADLSPSVHLLPAQINFPLAGAEVSGTVPIQWAVAGQQGQLATTLFVSNNAGKSWRTLIAGAFNVTSFDWNTRSFADGTRYLLRLFALNDSSFAFAESAATFTVNNPGNAAPEIELTAPIGGEIIEGEFEIAWRAADADGDSLHLALDVTFTSGQTWNELAQNLPNTGRYRWDTTPMPNSTNYQIRIRCADDSVEVEASSLAFSIQNPRLPVPDDLVEHVAGNGSGTVQVNIANASEITGHRYRLTFDDTSAAAKTYAVFDENAGAFVLQNATEMDGITEGPAFDGIRLIIKDIPAAKVDPARTGWQESDTDLSATVSLPAINLGDRILYGFPQPSDYVLTVNDQQTGISASYWGAPPTPTYFSVQNITENHTPEVLYIKARAHPGIAQNDEIYIVEKDENAEPVLTWLIAFSGSDNAKLPQAGDKFLLTTLKPFSHRDIFSFSTRKTAVASENGRSVPLHFELHSNFPNPFNPETTISYQLPKSVEVQLTVFNTLGQRVALLVNAKQPAGFYSLKWHGKSDAGSSLATGIYFYRLQTPAFTKVRKLMILR